MTNIITVQHQIDLKTTECCECGIIFGMPSDLYDYRVNDHGNFYCPNGHGQSFVGKSEAQRLKEMLAEEQRKLSQAQFELMATEKKVKRLEKRAKNGVCPCCHRQFVSVARHMKTKHPDFANEANHADN